MGPTYADKAHRSTAIRVADLINPDRLATKLRAIVADRNTVFGALYKQPPIDVEQLIETYTKVGQRLAPFVADTSRLLIDAWKAGKRIVFEGANANLLDVDHGTYPFVTSSNCSGLGLFTGAGAPPQCVKNFVGIMKAYCTRVGGGPFPTEQDNATGQYIRERGREYGTTTGRPRRCGWLDVVATRYSVELNGITSIALTLLDVLSGLDEIKIATGYTLNGKPLDGFRADMDTLAEVQPVYETLPGWQEDISAVRDYADLPANAKKYVERIEALLGAPIQMVSVGPQREATLMR
ncbi:MAG: adenylosuccinate synthetase [Tepidisphaeraceae bacterium]